MAFLKIFMSYIPSASVPHHFFLLSDLICSGFFPPKAVGVQCSLSLSRGQSLTPWLFAAHLLPLQKRLPSPAICPAPESSQVRVSANSNPYPTPFKFCYGMSLFLLSLFPFFQDVERRVPLRLTKKEKGPESYSPAGMCVDLTAPEPRKRKVKPKEGASSSQGRTIQSELSASQSSCLCASCPGFRAQASPPAAPSPSLSGANLSG